jgi:hypothetical protein
VWRGKRARCEGPVGAGAAVVGRHEVQNIQGGKYQSSVYSSNYSQKDPDIIIIHSSRAAGWLQHWLQLRLLPQKLLAP